MMLGDSLRPVAPLLVRERAFAEVRDAIISGRLAPGTRLIERELCAALGISRASVREMIRRLEAERLVAVEPRRGPTVIALTPKQAREIYEIRGMLEALLIRRFTELATDEQIEGLMAIFGEVENAAAGEDAQAIAALMVSFNAHLLDAVNHEIARDLLGQLNARIHWLRIRAMAKPGRIAESIREIRAVLRAVVKRDPERAARGMAASSAKARDAALEHLPAEQKARAKSSNSRAAGRAAPRPASRGPRVPTLQTNASGQKPGAG
jgi:DNA-binding GntR family transcriptional regulator